MKRSVLILALLIILTPITSYAGHTATGAWCECCAIGCICDPGEFCRNGLQKDTKEEPKSVPEGDSQGLSTAAELALIALPFVFLWWRIR